MLDSAQVQTIHNYIAAYNNFDVDGMLKHLSPDVRFENWSAGQLTTESNGIDQFRRLADQARTLFSEREQRIVSIKQCNASIIIVIAYRGRLAVDIPHGPRAGTVLDLAGESEFAFNGHLIAMIVDRS